MVWVLQVNQGKSMERYLPSLSAAAAVDELFVQSMEKGPACEEIKGGFA